MIRIDLLHRRKNRLLTGSGLIAAAVLMIAAGVTGLYWVDQYFPLHGVWKALWTPTGEEVVGDPSVDPSAVWMEAEGEGEVPVDVEEEVSPTAVVEEEFALPTAMEEEPAPTAAAGEESVTAMEEEPGPTEPVVGESAAAEEESVSAPPVIPEHRPQAKTALRVAAVDTAVAGEHRSALRESAACLWFFKVTEQLPSSARLMSLTCKASGEYSLEGVGSSDRDVEGFVETLQQLPSQVDLTLWREGRVQTSPAYRFVFHGQFEELFPRDLEAMSVIQARTLAGKVDQWARQSGLDRVSLKGPIDVPLDTEHAQRRHKLWATGSHAQIGGFLRQLKQVEDIATLGEVVIVPVHPEGEDQDLARLYAAVDLLVRQP